jgi:NAD(P)-dependent dehydrogenase (short-subunit alcohol dehydrogenase family)
MPTMNDALAIFGLDGEHAVVSGGGSGLGLAIATCFVAAGARVTITGTNLGKLESAAAGLGPKAGYARFDVTDVEDAESFAASLAKQHGAATILVNNAGNTLKKPIADMTPTDFQSVLGVHVGGAYALSRAFLPQIAQAGGSILFTASMSSFLGIPNVIGYAAAKSAYVGMVRSMSTELAPQGVRVNGVAPGWIDTALFREATSKDPARKQKIEARIPMQRFGDPADVGWAMTYLASKAAGYVSGHVLVVDGGALHAF